MKTLVLLMFFFSFPFWANAQLRREVEITPKNFKFIKEKGFDRILFNDGLYTSEIGKPELPILVQSFVIPKEAKVSGLQVQIIKTEKINGFYNIYPVQPPQVVGKSKQKEKDKIAQHPTIYNSLSGYPASGVQIVADKIIQGYHIVTVHIYPLEYIPYKKEVYLRELSFTITYEKSNLIKESKYKISYNRAILAKNFIKSLVENPQDVDIYYDDSYINPQPIYLNEKSNFSLKGHSLIQEKVPDYLIITSSALKPMFNLLAQWKTKKGVLTIIKTVEEIKRDYQGFDLVDKIRNYILECKSKWGNNLFILLGGDISIIPSRTFKGYEGIEVTDTYYSVDGKLSWNLQNPKWNSLCTISSYLGRIPVKNVAEAFNFIGKILSYEKADKNIDYSYLNNSLIISAYCADDGISRGHMGEIFGYCQNRLNNYWYLFDHFNCTKNDHEQQNYKTIDGEELNKSNFLYALQNGKKTNNSKFHFVYHADHSIPTAMGASSRNKSHNITLNDADGLSYSPYYYQIMMSVSCHPADFSKDCIAAHFLKKTNAGAIAFIGNTDVGFDGEEKQLKFFLDGTFANNSSNINQYSIGYLFLQALTNERNNYPNNCRLHLLGDPEMPIWTEAPENLNITLTPNQIVSGVNAMRIKINNLPANQAARICLMKGEEVYIVRDVTGPGEEIFTLSPRTSGNLNITITAHNFRPYETTVPVKTNTNSALTISNLVFEDGKVGKSVGNGDGQLDAGETIEVGITLKNGGAITASGVTGTLSCNSSSIIHLLNSQADFGTIIAGTEGTSQTKFRFQIDKDAKEILKNDLNAIQFTLNLTDSEYTSYVDTFKISITTQKLYFSNPQIIYTSNGDLIPQAGELVHFTVDIQNEGKATTEGLLGILSSTSSNIESCNSTPVSFPAISKNETKQNSTPFSFRVKDNYQIGNTLMLNIKLIDSYKKEQNITFSLLYKPDKINSSNITFKSYKNAIDVYWPNDYYLYNIYRSKNGINGEYVKLNYLPLSSNFFKDEELTSSTIYYYKVNKVSSYGNISPFSDPIKAWTSYPLINSFPCIMAMPNGILGSVNVGDVNNDGKKEIFATTKWYNENGDSYLIGLNSNGTELFDIDNKTNTFSGFAKLQATAVATPAIGDLYGKGEENIVTLTRNNDDTTENYLSCFSGKDKNGDGLPDLLWQKRINTPFCRGAVLANVDNSSDGTLEIIIGSCDVTAPIKIFSCDGRLLSSFGNGANYSCLAVADLDGDGDKEIIAAYGNSLYIWHHTGKSYDLTNPFFSVKNGEDISSSPIVCDLNGDGNKEILIASNRTDTTHIYAISLKGDRTVIGWNRTQTISYNSEYGFDHGLSVGDLNRDGKLEVAALGINKIKVWSYDGKILLDKTISGILNGGEKYTPNSIPILADVDGNNIPEIIFSTTDAVHALNLNGQEVVGFPLQTNTLLGGSVCVSDIDNDGKNELLAGDFGGYIYNWKTNGKPSGIEWGSERHDSHNTGEYGSICSPLLITSNTTWNGTQNPCGNIIIESGKLTVPAGKTVTLGETSKIIVRKGATLEVDGGIIQNAYIWALNGSAIILKDGGKVILRNQGCFDMELGAELDNEYGSIE